MEYHDISSIKNNIYIFIWFFMRFSEIRCEREASPPLWDQRTEWWRGLVSNWNCSGSRQLHICCRSWQPSPTGKHIGCCSNFFQNYYSRVPNIRGLLNKSEGNNPGGGWKVFKCSSGTRKGWCWVSVVVGGVMSNPTAVLRLCYVVLLLGLWQQQQDQQQQNQQQKQQQEQPQQPKPNHNNNNNNFLGLWLNCTLI